MLSSGVAGLLPLLVSGFLFAVIFFPTRYVSAQFDGQRLFFLCAACGLAVGLAAAFLYPSARDVVLAHWPSTWPAPGPRLSAVLPGPQPGAYAFVLLLGPAFALLLNMVAWIGFPSKRWRRGWSMRWWRGWEATVQLLVPRLGDSLQQFVFQGAMHQKPIQVSLKSGRVYIGLLHTAPRRPHAGLLHLEIITWYSLMRDEDSGKFPSRELWTVYPSGQLARARAFLDGLNEAIAKVTTKNPSANASSFAAKFASSVNTLKDKLPDIPQEDWVRLIPVGEIETVAYFNEAVYDWFTHASVVQAAAQSSGNAQNASTGGAST